MLAKKRYIHLLLIISLACLPSVASAHLVSTRFGELYSGLLHPLTALIHVVPWLALGLLGGLQGRETARWVLLVFPLSVFAGAMSVAWLPELVFIEIINVLSFIVLGILVALARELGTVLFLSLVTLVGLSHGYANGAAQLVGNQQVLYVTGVTLAAYLLITLITSLAYLMARHQHWSKVAVRALGSWIAAVGIVFGGSLFINVTSQF